MDIVNWPTFLCLPVRSAECGVVSTKTPHFTQVRSETKSLFDKKLEHVSKLLQDMSAAGLVVPHGSSNPGISWSVSKQIPNLITSGYTIEIKASQMITCCAGESQRCRRADTSQGEHVFFMPWSPTGLECCGCRMPNQDMIIVDIVPMANTFWVQGWYHPLYVKIYQNNLKNRISLQVWC